MAPEFNTTNVLKALNGELGEYCVMCGEKMSGIRQINTLQGVVSVPLCNKHYKSPELEILDVLFNDAEKLIK